MPSPPPNDEARRLQLLTSQLCDQNIEADQAEELAALLHGNADNIATYCAITALHLDLSQELRTPMEVTTSQIGKGRPASWWSRVNRQQKSLAAIAAVLLVALTVWLTNRVEEPDYTARIVEKIDCNWGEDQWGASKSNLLDIGREIELERGLMVVEFASGAEVMLEAPVRFAVVTASRGRLDRGKLTAHVDERGRGFAIDLPGVELVDLGTRFGASVDKTGVCEAHVFEGSIELRDGEKVPERQTWNLTRGEAMQFNLAEPAPRRFVARPEAFIHADRFNSPRPTDVTIPISASYRSDSVFWFHASRKLQLDETAQVVAWGNLTDSGNRKKCHAWQIDVDARPKYLWDETLQHSAVRFDGDDHLEIAPFSTKGDVAIYCAFQCSKLTAAACLIDLGGSVSLWLDTPMHGRLRQGQANVAVYKLDRSTGVAALSLNGQTVYSSRKVDASFGALPKVIGATCDGQDHFVGELLELAVFSGQPSPSKLASIHSEWLRNYGIQKEDSEPRILAPPHALNKTDAR